MRSLLVFLLTAVAALAAGQKIVGGPFAVNVTARTGTVVWIVQSDEGTIHPAAGGAAKSAPSLHVEKTTFTGLQPGTRYEYNVSGQDAGKGSFQTAPGAGTPYHFLVYGDTRTRHDVHRRVIGALLKQGIPDFAVHTGDLVENGDDPALWPIFFDIERELLRQTAFFPVLGNHERNSRNYYEFFQMETPYRSFDWGNAHFLLINSDLANVSASPAAQQAFWAEQTRWMEEDLGNNQAADFRFVVAHHPPFTAVNRRQGNNPHMTALVPMLEKYHVTAGFFGHDHNYQHYSKNGVHYVISGGGGAPLYDVDKPPQGITVKVISTENFTTVSVDGKVARVEAIDADGKTIDRFELQGGGRK
jgi:acid phosphatase type 7